MSRDLDSVLSAIDGALADDEFPDAMRWSPEPEAVDAPHPFDGEYVTVGPEHSDPSQWVAEYDAEYVTPGGMYRGPAQLGNTTFLRLLEQRMLEQIRPDPAVELRRTQSRIIERSQRRGPTADLLIFDEAFLVDPAHREEVRARQQAAAQRIVVPIAEMLNEAGKAIVQMTESIGAGIGRFVQLLATAQPRPPQDARPLRERDPRAYALQMRQSRGTGPDRQMQHQYRPRRHR